MYALVLPQPVYQEFASLRPPLGGRTRLVTITIPIIIIVSVKSFKKRAFVHK